MKIAIIGSGPAGLYTASHLLKNHPSLHIDVFDKFPFPYGLVRSGVAPDHPSVKNVCHKFNALFLQQSNPNRLRFLGNVKLGNITDAGSLSLLDLKSCYHGIVLAYGATRDRKLNLKHEFETKNLVSSMEFVGWYNGHLDYTRLNPNLFQTDTALIIGNGNVAIDIARMLLTPVETLAKTDITQYSLDALAQSRIKNVYIIGRRGPVQASFTSQELREIKELHANFYINQELISREMELNKMELDKNRPKKRLLQLLQKDSHNSMDYTKSLYLEFLYSPKEILRDANKNVSSLVFEKNRLELGKAIGTGELKEFKAGLVIKSIGYTSQHYDGIPWDPVRNIVPNQYGVVEKGLYVAGWLKKGPVGTIATTLFDANETADSLLGDVDELGSIKSNLRNVDELLSQKGIKPYSFSDWQKMEAQEIHNGQLKGKPREKMVSLQEIHDLIHLKQ